MQLPLTDGAFLIDNSTLELLTTCPRALFYNSFLKREFAAARPALNFGGGIHAALEYRYRSRGNSGADYTLEVEQAKVLEDYFLAHPQPEGDFRQVNHAIEVIKGYNARYPVEQFSVLLDESGLPIVELSFMLELATINGIRVFYTGRIDLPFTEHGHIYIMDHKTTSSLGQQKEKEFLMSAQMRGYCWAFAKATGKECSGYRVNLIRVRPPAKSRPSLSQADDFERIPYYLRPGEIEEWRTNTIALIEELFWHASRDYFPMKTRWCSAFTGCQYFEVCSGAPHERDGQLASSLYTDKVWSPLNKPKTLKT